MSFCLTNFQPIRPRYEIPQQNILEWLAKLHARAAHGANDRDYDSHYLHLKTKLSQLGTNSETIKSRGVQLLDPLLENDEEREIYSLTRSPGFKERMRFFDREVSEIVGKWYTCTEDLPQQMIHVTCTGYVSPSPAQKIVSRLEGKNTVVTHAYHMGCYASMPAMRMALGALALPSPMGSRVDILHTELCSLHMHPLHDTTEQLIVQSLFADGFIKYSVHREEDFPDSHYLSIVGLLEEIIPDSINYMTWSCDDLCHAMTLGKEVPVVIARFVEGYLSRLIQRTQLDESSIRQSAYFAIHPGGPKIIEQLKQRLSLREDQIAHSTQILRNYGNMSSATLPHIWEKMLHDPDVQEGSYIVSMAFGPGLTISGSILQKRVKT